MGGPLELLSDLKRGRWEWSRAAPQVLTTVNSDVGQIGYDGWGDRMLAWGPDPTVGNPEAGHVIPSECLGLGVGTSHHGQQGKADGVWGGL